ncbi:MAG: ABC transporter permease subunit [Bacteroidales bacterium]|nr:ABC transporter permease subunit [Bacteroidales bacterium]
MSKPFFFVLVGLVSLALGLSTVSCKSKVESQAPMVSSINDLNGHTVAVLMGSIYEIEVQRLYPEIKLLTFNTWAEMVAAVNKGNAEYTMSDNIYLPTEELNKLGIEECFNSNELFVDVCLGFSYSNTALRDSFNVFMQGLKESGVNDSLIRHWTTGDNINAPMAEIPLPSTGQPLIVGVNNGSFPMEFFRDGKWVGYEIELIERFAAHINRPVEYHIYDFSAIITSLVSGKTDIIACFLGYTEERAKQVAFSESYIKGNFQVCRALSVDNRSQASFWKGLTHGFHNNFIVENRWKVILSGLWVTIYVTLLSLLFGSILGCVLCWMRMSRRKWLASIAKVYIEIFRDLPILVILMLMFYVVFASSNIAPEGVAVVSFSMAMAAFAAEIFRSGISGVDRGQTEAGLAMGFSKVQTLFYFVIPQAFQRILPVFRGEAVSLLKNTSIVGYIAIIDLTKAGDMIRSRTFDAFLPLIVVSIIYFILSWLMGKAISSFETTKRK